MHYIAWAALGMAGYSLTTLFVKLATRAGPFGPFAILPLAVSIVCTGAWANALLSGAFAGKTASDFVKPGALWIYATGFVLLVAVGSLFKGLSLGPASVVVPIYGMFILGGAVLGIVFLHEPLTARKALGLVLAAASVYLIAR
jgi:transporter family protein